MKTMIAKASLLALSAMAFTMTSRAQNAKDNDKAAATKQLIEAKQYVFIAQSAMPLSGRVRQLTPDYDLKVKKDTIVSWLPYFGRAYSAPMDPTQGGIQFTSTSFQYTVTPRKKGGWDISIKPGDARDVQQMQLSVSETGYASLQVISVNRQAISFNGYITAIKEKKKK
jgi:hypothetical protein